MSFWCAPTPTNRGLSYVLWQTVKGGGADAARIAPARSLEAASTFPAKELFDEASWPAVVSSADEAVCEDDAAGYTILVCLCVSERQVCGASCGDSGALLLNGGHQALLSEDQHKNPPVGSSAARPAAFSARLRLGWKLLVVSDGVWRGIGWDAIGGLAQKSAGEELLAALRQAALDENGGKMGDDFSVALLQDDATL